tara:strand:- start:28 stop:588 length:561 start_codon:yes stop_codon:yes gene_type:complete
MASVIQLQSLKHCKLAIGSYPHFNYDASGGGGKAIVADIEKNNIQRIQFSPNRFIIPSINIRTSKILGLPLPPGIEIKILLEKLEGTILKEKGEVSLTFKSKFILSILNLYDFPKLSISTKLTTGKIKSKLFTAEGRCISKNGQSTLVGVATIPKSGNKFLDIFLGLPNESLAKLNCKILEQDLQI